MESIISQLNQMKEVIEGLMARLDITGKAEAINQLEKEASDPDIWQDQERARQVTQRLSQLKDEVNQWQALSQRINDALELAEMQDDSLLEDLTAETESLQSIVERAQLQAMLSGQYDSENAILAIHAGAGGVDAQDWARMLMRMYLRWMERNGYKADILDESPGEEPNTIKSVTISVQGQYAYGYLQSERGVHRLVRLSPFDSASRRHTSFAKVELWPDIQGEIDITIDEKDIRVDTYRAGGAGGQHVQKNDTAVRITHIPTGIVVQCQNQRSQKQNRDRAMQILKARLFELEQQKQQAELDALRGENVDAGWGNQIRSYVLHPYQMVKDHRTGMEVGNTGAVLDGELMPFMEAYLRYKINSGVQS
ncbi:MAG: peptide chain release factor 2 [Chloroflexi bacterium]|nr:MAG: peptide chain release factor 2 [Chloroflexota bacterium]